MKLPDCLQYWISYVTWPLEQDDPARIEAHARDAAKNLKGEIEYDEAIYRCIEMMDVSCQVVAAWLRRPPSPQREEYLPQAREVAKNAIIHVEIALIGARQSDVSRALAKAWFAR